MLHVIGVEKKSMASALGAQNAELRFCIECFKAEDKDVCSLCGGQIEDLP
jgi:recombinational DNA repair protein RecR